jgi:hypothetical protein
MSECFIAAVARWLALGCSVDKKDIPVRPFFCITAFIHPPWIVIAPECQQFPIVRCRWHLWRTGSGMDQNE